MTSPRALRLTLVAAAATAATRRVAFPDDEPPEEGALRAAAEVMARLPRRPRAWTSPARAARATAEALGLEAEVEGALADCDHGAWRGQSLAAVGAADPAGLSAWLSDPAAAPHGGEPLADLHARVACWLDTLPATVAGEGAAVAVTHAGVIRAAIVHVLAAPAPAFWRIDVPPLSTTRLVRSGGRWTLRLA